MLTCFLCRHLVLKTLLRLLTPLVESFSCCLCSHPRTRRTLHSLCAFWDKHVSAMRLPHCNTRRRVLTCFLCRRLFLSTLRRLSTPFNSDKVDGLNPLKDTIALVYVRLPQSYPQKAHASPLLLFVALTSISCELSEVSLLLSTICC
jgi:hypothetical protein